MIKTQLVINSAFYKMDNNVSDIVKKNMDTITDDLLRVAQERAPVDSRTLEHSGTKTGPQKSGNSIVSQVSFRAKKRGFNYAIKMDKTRYKLGDKSLQKSSRGVRSVFSNETFKVGTGYLSDTADKCHDKYIEYVEDNVSKEIKKMLGK